MKYHFTSFEILSYTWLNESLFHQSKKQLDERFENECIEARVVVAIVIVKVTLSLLLGMEKSKMNIKCIRTLIHMLFYLTKD